MNQPTVIKEIELPEGISQDPNYQPFVRVWSDGRRELVVPSDTSGALLNLDKLKSWILTDAGGQNN